jgi:hypothetical protein
MGWIGWRKLHNDELHNLYSSPHFIILAKSRRKRIVGHVEHIREKIMHIIFRCERQKERDQWEDIDVGERTILKWISRRE